MRSSNSRIVVFFLAHLFFLELAHSFPICASDMVTTLVSEHPLVISLHQVLDLTKERWCVCVCVCVCVCEMVRERVGGQVGKAGGEERERSRETKED